MPRNQPKSKLSPVEARRLLRQLFGLHESFVMKDRYASLAQDFGVNPRTIYRWLRGDTKMANAELLLLETLVKRSTTLKAVRVLAVEGMGLVPLSKEALRRMALAGKEEGTILRKGEDGLWELCVEKPINL